MLLAGCLDWSYPTEQTVVVWETRAEGNHRLGQWTLGSDQTKAPIMGGALTCLQEGPSGTTSTWPPRGELSELSLYPLDPVPLFLIHSDREEDLYRGEKESEGRPNEKVERSETNSERQSHLHEN